VVSGVPMNEYKGFLSGDPLGLNGKPSSYQRNLNVSKANYMSLYVSSIDELAPDAVPRLIERIDQILLTANGYILVGQTQDVQKYIDDHRMEIFAMIQGYKNAEREAVVTKELDQQTQHTRAAYAKEFLVALINTPPVFRVNPPVGAAREGTYDYREQVTLDPDPAKLAPLAVRFADELIKALNQGGNV